MSKPTAGAGEGWLQEFFQAAPVPTAVLGGDGCYLAVNATFCDLLQRSPRELLGQGFADVTHDEDLALSDEVFARLRSGGAGSQQRLEKRYLRSDGAKVHAAVHLVAVVIRGELRVLVQVIDLTEQRRAEAMLAHQATHDPATGLVTRGVLLEQLSRALARLPRTQGRFVAVLFCDLDRLKYVNDTYGHLAGDALIAEFATRVRATVRPSDVVARIGGDEFAVLLEDVGHPGESTEIAQRVLAALAEPFSHHHRRLEIRASIGIAVSTTEKTTPEAILAHADAAMYRAKQRGRGRYELFDDDAYAAARQRQHLEEQLRSAFTDGELLLHYQPMLDLVTRRVAGVEALLRWNHPQRGILTASQFIAVAEEADLLRPITGWLFTTACAQLAAWDTTLGAAAPREVYVNVAGSQLADEHLPATIAGALEQTGIPATRVKIEVTETQILTDPGHTTATVAALRGLGCDLVVDDFGTGYSTLSRITELPVTGLKLDRSFVIQLSNSREAAAIGASVALLAHNLRYTLIAEGVETPSELTAVTELGCHLAQGHLISPALPAEELTRWLLARGV